MQSHLGGKNLAKDFSEDKTLEVSNPASVSASSANFNWLMQIFHPCYHTTFIIVINANIVIIIILIMIIR